MFNAFKASGLLAVCGYISLRAHLNHLGAPSGYSLGFDRYLMETYHFFQAAAVPVLLLIAAACLIGCMLLYFRPKYFRGFNVVRLAAQPSPGIFGALILITLALIVWLIAGAAASGWDVAVGKLDANKIRPSGSYMLFAAAAAFCGLACLYWQRAHTALEQVNLPEDYWFRVFLYGLFAALLVLTLELPVYYGACLRSVEYPEAEITVLRNAQPAMDGLILLEDSSNVTFWYAEQQQGRFLVIPRSQIDRIVYGGLKGMERYVNGSQAQPHE
jgi:hypothetical protein